ncbi:MAG: hypothetical protein H6581_27165 [Bacteroidia bacterium]|nr:hypothetical protein [Bacteroidia bacterium]
MIEAQFQNLHLTEKPFDLADGLRKLDNAISVIFKILLFPLILPILLLLWVFAIVPLGLKLRSLNKWIEGELDQIRNPGTPFEKLNFKETKDLHTEAKSFLNKYQDLINSQDLGSNPFLYPLGSEIKRFSMHFGHFEEVLGKKLFIQSEESPFSHQQIRELSDFFGPEEDYDEDTFDQLNLNG